MVRSIVITGASKGIGRATTDALVEDGWSVIGVARSSPANFPGVFMGRTEETTDRAGRVVWPVLVHSARTAVAAVASLLVARLFQLPEAYWAPITTLVITQSSLGAALAFSWQRFVGTALGALVGAIAASYFGSGMLVFAASVFILGLLSAAVSADRSAYRFGGITLAIVLVIPRIGPAWRVAFHRFAEVSIGIAVALILTVGWPEKEIGIGAGAT